MEQDRRRSLRIKYTDKFRPNLAVRSKEGSVAIAEKEYELIDISENGMRFSGEGESGFRLRLKVEAEVTFSDGESSVVEGEVLRITDNEVAIYFSKGIPFSRIIKELKLTLRKI